MCKVQFRTFRGGVQFFFLRGCVRGGVQIDLPQKEGPRPIFFYLEKDSSVGKKYVIVKESDSNFNFFVNTAFLLST